MSSFHCHQSKQISCHPRCSPASGRSMGFPRGIDSSADGLHTPVALLSPSLPPPLYALRRSRSDHGFIINPFAIWPARRARVPSLFCVAQPATIDLSITLHRAEASGHRRLVASRPRTSVAPCLSRLSREPPSARFSLCRDAAQPTA